MDQKLLNDVQQFANGKFDLTSEGNFILKPEKLKLLMKFQFCRYFTLIKEKFGITGSITSSS